MGQLRLKLSIQINYFQVAFIYAMEINLASFW